MALRINFETPSGVKSIRVDELGLEVLEAIAVQDAVAEDWSDITQSPFRNVYRTYAVLDAAADQLGIEHIERNLSPRSLDDLLEIVPNIEEMPMGDGLPQVPDGTEAGSSSISPGPLTTGPQMSPDDSRLQTS